MPGLRNTTATVLVFFVFHLSLLDALNAANTTNPSSIKHLVDQFGVGARVGVKLGSGQKLRGSIGAIDNQSFLFNLEREDSPRRVAYEDVAELKLAKRRYHASQEPNPLEAKRVAMALGMGKHVVVKTTDGKELHGRIQAIEDNSFEVLPDNQTKSVQIAYENVRHLEKNLSFGATIVLVVLIVAAVVVIGAVAANR